MKEDIIVESSDKFERFINDPDKLKPEYSNLHKRAEILKLENFEDLKEYSEYLIDNKMFQSF